MSPSAKTVEGCKACGQAKSGVCIRHQNADVENHPRRCNGLRPDGSRCRKWGVKHSEPALCITHSEDTAAAEAAKRAGGQARSAARKAQRASSNALEMLGRDYEQIDSIEKLEAVAAEALDFMAFLREEMKRSIAEGGDDAEKTINRYVSALDRTGKLLEVFSKQGLQEREVKTREELVGVVTGLWNTVLASFVPPELQPQAQAALAAAVATLQPKALTA